MKTKKHWIFDAAVAVAMSICVMAGCAPKAHAVTNVPNVGPIVVPAAAPQSAALGRCNQLYLIQPGETVQLSCTFTAPVPLAADDVVISTAGSGVSQVECWTVYTGTFGPAPVATVYVVFALRNLTTVEISAEAFATAAVFYTPKSTTPAVVAAGVE